MGSAAGACAGCGSPLPSDAAFCPRCGRRRAEDAPTRVELTPLGEPPRSPDAAYAPRHDQSAVVAMRRPDSRRLLVVLAAVAAVGLLAIAIAGMVLDDSGGAAAPATTSDTTTSTTGTSTTIATTATPGPKPLLAPTVPRPSGPVLDPAQNVWSVYVSDARVVRRVDLATGRVTERDLAPLVGDFHLYGVVAGRLLFDSPVGVQSIAADLLGDVRTHPLFPDGGRGSLTIAFGDRVWALRYDDRSATSIATLSDLDGNRDVSIAFRDGDYPVGFLGDRAIIQRRGRTYLLNGAGTFDLYANGEPVAVRNGFVLWVGCDAAAKCTYHVGDVDHPDLGITSIPDTRPLRINGQERRLAPDGQAVVVATGAGDGRSLVKLNTGSEIALPIAADQLEWTPDGAWLVRYEGGVLYALDVRGGRILSFDLGVTNLRSATFEMVIG